MPRNDLLALTEDDLITLTNRGTVRRALRELESGTFGCEFEELADGTLLANWSDGMVCRFPPGGALEDAVCSSGATGISRHVVRSVLAYGTAAGEHDTPTDPTADEPWDPGCFTDDELRERFGKAAVTKARTQFDRGMLAEVVRSRKPLVQFLHEPCTVRFLVPGNLRFVYADCAERFMPRYIPQAVWAFRELPAERAAGVVSIQNTPLAVPVDILDDVETALVELFEHGVESCTSAWRGRAVRLEERCRAGGLVWPAEILHDLLHQIERYHEHDARYDPREVAQFIGEASIRCDAIRADTKALPQLLIRGTKSDALTEIRTARFIGLGCGVRVGSSSARLTAFHQDVDSGNVVAIHREFVDPAADSQSEPREFTALGRTTISRGVSFSRLAAGQLLLKSAKRAPSHELKLPRGSLSVNPQAFQWEKLRPPVLAEGFEEIAARLSALPPAGLRPRRATENLHVCPIRSIEAVDFNASGQRLLAILQDPHGATAVLSHPYRTRGRQGFEALAATLNHDGDSVRYLSGHFRHTGDGLYVEPLCLILESKGKRTAVQPWIDEWQGDAAEFGDPADIGDDRSPIQARFDEMADLVSDAVTVGVRRLGSDAATRWKELGRECSRTGFIRFTELAEQIAAALEARSHTSRWSATEAIERFLQLNALLQLTTDECAGRFR